MDGERCLWNGVATRPAGTCLRHSWRAWHQRTNKQVTRCFDKQILLLLARKQKKTVVFVASCIHMSERRRVLSWHASDTLISTVRVEVRAVLMKKLRIYSRNILCCHVTVLEFAKNCKKMF